MYSIETYRDFTKINGVSKDILDLDKTFNCGQCFRWRRLKEGTYYGVIFGKPLIIRQMQFDDGNYGIITTYNRSQVDDILMSYLQLNVDYEKQISLGETDIFAKEAKKFGQGIRILGQEPWETLVSFIISQRNNIPKIASTIERTCTALGEKIDIEVEGSKYTGNTFPSAEKIMSVGLVGLQGLGLGYRDVYIIEAAKAVSNGSFKLNELASNDIGSEWAIIELQNLYGIGPKVASCIALFGLGKLDSFPIDVWMQRVIDRYYPKGINIDSYGKLAGLMQQYMFYYIKNN